MAAGCQELGIDHPDSSITFDKLNGMSKGERMTPCRYFIYGIGQVWCSHRCTLA